MKFLLYLPLTLGIASLISIYAWSNFVLGSILGILGVVLIYIIQVASTPKEENIFYSGFVVSALGVFLVINHLIEMYFD